MGSFYSRLSYSFGNEDWATEHKALNIQPEDTVICVTASGDRPLNLLTKDLKQIIAIDANPFQNALFDLKKAAMSRLPFPEYLAFMGAVADKDRQKTYWRELEQDLNPTSRMIWKRHQKKIKNGIIYEGAVEKWLKRASKFLRQVRGKKIERLFSFEDLKEQEKFIKEEWETFFWKKLFEVSLHPFVTRYFIQDPGLYAYVDPKIHVGKYLHQRLHSSLCQILAKESVLMSLCLKGEVQQASYPPYLNRSEIEGIKSRLHLARFETLDLISYLRNSKDDSYDCFSVSDVASYLPTSEFLNLIRHIYRTAKDGARFCIRQFLSNHLIPEEFAPAFKRDTELEETLRKEDRCMVYHFMVGRIQK